MSLDPDFLEFMPETVYHAEFAGRDKNNVPSYGSQVSYSARVQYKPTWVRAADGSEVVARGVVWIGGTPTLDAQDELQLPDGTTPPILAVERHEDEDGAHHVKVYFG